MPTVFGTCRTEGCAYRIDMSNFILRYTHHNIFKYLWCDMCIGHIAKIEYCIKSNMLSQVTCNKYLVKHDKQLLGNDIFFFFLWNSK